MSEESCHETYPAGTVVIATLLPLLMYGIGIWLLSRIGIVWAAGYALFVLLLEYRLLHGHCADCYYYGKRCAFGKGYLCALLFPRGRPERFSTREISWTDLVPDLLVFLIPILAGILLLVREFSVTVLILAAILLIRGFLGNAFVRGQLACRFCRQRESGCPAFQLFDRAGR